MKENMFWDKNMSTKEIKSILRDESHTRFIDFASLLLSRTGKIREVFRDYLDKVTFCKNWRKIKKRMRSDKWNDPRISFCEEVYRVVLQKIDKNELRDFFRRYQI